MPIDLYFSGTRADIYLYVAPRGKAPASDFIENLNDSEQKKVVRLLKEFAERGEIRNREKFRVEEKPIYAFKSHQVRILCFYLPDAPKRTIVLTHGLRKKQDYLPPRELEKALRIYSEIVNN